MRPAAASGGAPRRQGTGTAALLAVLLAALPAASGAADLEAGKRFYREGITATGEPAGAVLAGGVAVTSSNATCMSCHRRSGFGSIEGESVVPPIVGPILFNSGDPRSERVKASLAAMAADGAEAAARLRPAYDDVTLARAIREGVDSAGRPLDPLMPRYALDDGQAADLVAYLKSLSDAPSPGVTDDEIHFATVFAGPVPASRRQAMLDVFETFFADKNGLTRNEKERAERGPWYHEWKDRSYRQWRLHAWQLDGPAEGWAAQLDAYYAQQPVFALVGGIGTEGWEPIHRFCAANAIPCILPQTGLPVVAQEDFHNVYFSRGLALDAEALVRRLEGNGAQTGARRILQVYRDGQPGAGAAALLRQAVTQAGGDAPAEHRLEGEGPPGAAVWQDLLDRHRPDVLVLWLGQGDLAGLGEIGGGAGLPAEIYVSSALVDDPMGAVPASLRDRLYVTHGFALPEEFARQRRFRAWLRVKGIAETDAFTQAGAYATLRIMANTLHHMRAFLSRDYFIERMEHLVDSTLTDSPYPKLTLGPGRRFLSNRAYILHPAGDRLAAVQDFLLH